MSHTLKYSLLLMLLPLCGIVGAENIMLGTVEHTIDTLETFRCGPGSTYIQVQMRRVSDGQGRLDAFLMLVDRNNPYISFEEVLGGDRVVGTEAVSKMAERKNKESDTRIFFGGTNGDFFATTGDIGRPTGMTIVNNEFAYIPDNHGGRRVGAINEKMQGAIATTAAFSGKVIVGDTTLSLKRINYTRGENQLVLYNYHNGTSTGTNEYGTEVLLELCEGNSWRTNCSVRAIARAIEKGVGNMSYARGQVVLSAHGTMADAVNTRLNVGDTITINLTFKLDGVKQNISQSIGGDNYALIVDSGRVVESNFWNESHPRTAFGQTITGDTLIFCVVDGRAKSVGCTTQALGAIMQRHGAWKAVNWDGGGSSHLWLRNVGLMNAGCESAERAVGNGMFVVATVPDVDNTIAEIQAYSPVLRLPRYGMHKPKILGYNKYGLLLNTDVTGVTLSCDPEVGYINDDGAFVCLGDGELKLHYGEIVGSVQIRVADKAEIAMRHDTVVIYDCSDYAVEVMATVGKNSVLIQPSALSWQVADPAIATISETGRLNGLKDGETEIYGTLGEVTDTLVARVLIPSTKPLLYDNFIEDFSNRWILKPSSTAWNTEMKDINGTATLCLNFTGGRQANVRLTAGSELFSAPTHLELRFTPQGNLIQKVTLGLRAHNGVSTVNVSTEDFLAGQMNIFAVDLDSLFNADAAANEREVIPGNIGIYPVTLEFITLAFNTTAPKQEYAIPFDGLWLRYRGDTTPLDEVREDTFGAEGTHHKLFINGRMYIRRGATLYTVTGQPVPNTH